MEEQLIRATVEAVTAQLPTDLRLIGPEIIMAVVGMLALVVERFAGRERQRIVGYVALAGIFGAILHLRLLVSPLIIEGGRTGFSGLVIVDAYAIFFKIIFLIATALVILLSMRYLDEERAHHGEYYSLLMFATLGMMLMASGADLVTIFVGLELMALSIYVLVGFLRDDRRSNEAAMKYFILGAFSSAFFLYGISLFYGVTGSTSLVDLQGSIAGALSNPFTTLALIMMSVGLGFKVAAVPFHAWAPDVYEGALTPITAYISVASKAAAFSILLRILLTGLYDMRADWTLLLTVLALATMTLGNLVAIVQNNVKRMLAYSSIAHAGYVLIGVLAAGASVPDRLAGSMSVTQQVEWATELQRWAQGGVLIYLLAYAFMNIGAFGLVTMLRRQDIVGDRFDDFSGLAQRAPVAALAMTVFLLSLAGVPPTAGFIGKLFLFSAAMQAELYLVAIVAVLNTAVSLFFYMRIVVKMYMKDPVDDRPYAYSWQLGATVLASLFLTLLIGVYPKHFVAAAQASILEITTSLTTLTSLH